MPRDKRHLGESRVQFTFAPPRELDSGSRRNDEKFVGAPPILTRDKPQE